MNSISLKAKAGIASPTALVASTAFAISAFAQTVPTWDVTSTDAVVPPTATTFKSSIIYVLVTIWPYALAIGVVFSVGYFFLRLFRHHAHA